MYINLKDAANTLDDSYQSLRGHANDPHYAFAQAISNDTHRNF